jgi:hypothetical protein
MAGVSLPLAAPIVATPIIAPPVASPIAATIIVTATVVAIAIVTPVFMPTAMAFASIAVGEGGGSNRRQGSGDRQGSQYAHNPFLLWPRPNAMAAAVWADCQVFPEPSMNTAFRNRRPKPMPVQIPVNQFSFMVWAWTASQYPPMDPRLTVRILIA